MSKEDEVFTEILNQLGKDEAKGEKKRKRRKHKHSDAHPPADPDTLVD